jgi:hypothetical protein
MASLIGPHLLDDPCQRPECSGSAPRQFNRLDAAGQQGASQRHRLIDFVDGNHGDDSLHGEARGEFGWKRAATGHSGGDHGCICRQQQ